MSLLKLRQVKIAVFYLARFFGFFYIAEWFTRKELRILCYHGFSVTDEHRWFPGTFMTPALMRQRFRYIKKRGYRVLTLDQALEHMAGGDLPARALVLTFDDGFASTLAEGVPLLREFSFSAVLYVTSYYVTHAHPIFRLAVQYLFWKAKKTDFKSDLDRISQVIETGNSLTDNVSRDELIRSLGRELRIDAEPLFIDRRFHLLTPSEIKQCSEGGFEIQLHTHRHRFPKEPDLLRREIIQNREVLEPIVDRSMNHLCYPSGVYDSAQWNVLHSEGIQSATTCELGLNSGKTPRLGLKRQLDSETVTQVEFEAELSGFTELLRRALGKSSKSS